MGDENQDTESTDGPQVATETATIVVEPYRVKLIRESPGVDDSGRPCVHPVGHIVQSPRAYILCNPFNGQPGPAVPDNDRTKAKVAELNKSRVENIAALQARIDSYPRVKSGAKKGKIAFSKLNDSLKASLLLAKSYALDNTETDAD